VREVRPGAVCRRRGAPDRSFEVSVTARDLRRRSRIGYARRSMLGDHSTGANCRRYRAARQCGTSRCEFVILYRLRCMAANRRLRHIDGVWSRRTGRSLRPEKGWCGGYARALPSGDGASSGSELAIAACAAHRRAAADCQPSGRGISAINGEAVSPFAGIACPTTVARGPCTSVAVGIPGPFFSRDRNRDPGGESIVNEYRYQYEFLPAR
jgi:hypothetical protein